MKDFVKNLKQRFPKGTRVRLLGMEDMQAPPVGTLGTVQCVDDIGTIHVRWENGSSLGLVWGEDSFEEVHDEN